MKKYKNYPISNYIARSINIKHIIIFCLLLIPFCSLFATRSYATGQYMKVSPVISDLQLVPGQATTIDLSVENLSDTPLGIHAQISGVDETGQEVFANQKTSPLIGWTNIPEPDIIIDPHSQKSITVVISPPKDAKESGYYETVFLTPIVSSQRNPSAPVVLSRVGSIILATIGNLNYDDLAKKVTIKDFKPGKFIFEKSPATLGFSVENKYFTHFTAKPFITLKPLFGQEETTLLEEKRVLPGTTRSWQFETKTEKCIFYRAELAVSVGEGHQILAQTWIIMLPYKLVLIPLLLLGIVYLILFKRVRVKKAILTLLRGK